MRLYKKIVVLVAAVLLLGAAAAGAAAWDADTGGATARAPGDGIVSPMAGGFVPAYYRPVSGKSNVYYFDEITNTKGGTVTRYRLLDADGEMYAIDADGNILSSTPVDFDTEKPQPSYYRDGTTANFPNLVMDINHAEQRMVEYTFVGRYRFNFAASSNVYSTSINNYQFFIQDEKAGFPLKVYSNTPGDAGYQYDYRYGFGNTANGAFTSAATAGVKSNGAYAVLEQPTAEDGTLIQASNIKQAFLVMEASSFESDANVRQATRVDMVNRPMTLLGPSGGSMLSNGYLPAGYTGSAYNSNSPTVFYTKLGSASRLRAVIITDVTDFVRQEGYGTYYGYDIPTKGQSSSNSGDNTGGWKLIVIEEDPTMQKNRIGSILIGNINSSNSINSSNTTLEVSFGGYRTPASGEIQGQFLFSSSGSNPGASQCTVRLYPNAAVNEYTQLTTNSTPIARGKAYNGFTSFGQSIITLDGVRRTNFSSYRRSTGVLSNLVDSTDFEVLEIDMDANGNSLQTANHNAILVHNAEAIKVDLLPSNSGDNYTVAVGVFATVDMPVFESAVTHTEVETGITGENIIAGSHVFVEMSATNVTNSTSATVGLTATRATISVDPRLTGITDLTLIYYDYGPDYDGNTPGWNAALGCVVRELSPVSSHAELDQNGLNYYYDEAAGIIYANVGMPIQVTAAGGATVTKQLFNSRGDALSVRFTATSSDTPATGITNSIRISGEDAVTSAQSIFELTPNEEYTFSSDVFNSTDYPKLTKNAYLKDDDGNFTEHENGAKDAPYELDIGKEIQYRLKLENDSDTPYGAITVSDTLPHGLEITQAQQDAIEFSEGTVSEANGIYTVSWELNHLLERSFVEFTFEATVADNGIVLQNQASYTMNPASGPHRGVSNSTYHIRKVQTLAISKQIVGDLSGVDLTFPVQISVTKNGGAARLSGSTTALITRDGFLPQQTTATFVNGIYTFTIRHGQTVSLELPVDWDYAVVENLPANDARYSVYEPVITGGSGTIGDTPPAGVTIENITAPALTKNAYINGDTTAVNGSTISPALVITGDSIVYELVLTNHTDTDRTGITMTDVLPAGLAVPTLVDVDAAGNTPAYNTGNRTVTWGGVTVPANGTATLRIETSVLATGDNTFTNVARYTTNFNGADITVESNNTVHQTVAGTLSVTKTINNAGPQEDTKDFTFTATFTGTSVPTSLAYVMSGPGTTSGVYDMALTGTTTSRTGTFTLRHGQTLTFRSITTGLGFTVTENDPSAEGYTVVYSGINGGDNFGTASATLQRLTATNYHLSTITKDAYINGASSAQNGTFASPATVKPGDHITYKISIRNSSLAEQSFTVEDVLPAGLTLDESSLVGGTNSSGTITWSGVAVGAGETTVLTFTATVDAAISYASQINFENTASYTIGGFSRSSNTTYHAIRPALLQVEKYVVGNDAGEQFEIKISLANPQQAGFAFSGTPAITAYSPGTTSSTLSDIPSSLTFAGGEASVLLRHDEGIRLYLPQGMAYTVEEELGAAQQGGWLAVYRNAAGTLAAAGATAAVTNYAYTTGDITLTKNAYIGSSTTAENGEAGAVGVDVGDTITYKLTLQNGLGMALSGVTITDVLPTGLQIVSIGNGGASSEHNGVFTVTWGGVTVPAAQGGTPGETTLTVTVRVQDVAAGTTGMQYNNRASTTIPNITGDILSGTTYHKLNLYTAKHAFVSSSAAWELPPAVLDLLPADIGNLPTGTEVEPTALNTEDIFYEMPDGSGGWRFDGWEPSSATVGSADMTFTGTWTFSANWYAAEYRFEHEDGVTDLPADLNAFLPARETEYDTGDDVTPKPPLGTVFVGTGENAVRGTWVFQKWDPPSATVVDVNIMFTGTWDFFEDEYPLQYEFTNGSPAYDLPDDVLALLPPMALYAPGTPLTLAVIDPAEVEDTTNDGCWNFGDFGAVPDEMPDTGVLATGAWTFAPNTYQATYSFENASSLPAEVMACLPSTETGFVDGEDVTPANPTETRVLVSGGEWNFGGWDALTITVDRDDVHFTGTWSYTAWHQVNYVFHSGTAGYDLPQAVLDLLPADTAYYPGGTLITPADVAPASVKVTDGTWTFEGWAPDEAAVPNDGDLLFEGTWVFTADPPPGPGPNPGGGGGGTRPIPTPTPGPDAAPDATPDYDVDVGVDPAPGGGTRPSIPQTGDEGGLSGYIALLSAAVAILAVAAILWRRGKAAAGGRAKG